MRRGWRIRLIAATVVVAGVVVLTVPWPSGALREVADRFSPPGVPSVGLGSYEPSRVFCLGDNACPSVHRLWVVNSPVTNEELQRWIDDAGYDASVKYDCATSCLAEGTANGWKVLVYAQRHSADPGTDVVLSIQQ